MQQNIDNPFLKVTGGLSLQHEPSQICNCDYVPQSAKYSDFLPVKINSKQFKDFWLYWEVFVHWSTIKLRK